MAGNGKIENFVASSNLKNNKNSHHELWFSYLVFTQGYISW